MSRVIHAAAPFEAYQQAAIDFFTLLDPAGDGVPGTDRFNRPVMYTVDDKFRIVGSNAYRGTQIVSGIEDFLIGVTLADGRERFKVEDTSFILAEAGVTADLIREKAGTVGMARRLDMAITTVDRVLDVEIEAIQQCLSRKPETIDDELMWLTSDKGMASNYAWQAALLGVYARVARTRAEQRHEKMQVEFGVQDRSSRELLEYLQGRRYSRVVPPRPTRGVGRRGSDD